MKNSIILSLAQVLGNASSNTVDVKDAYKILKWKSEFSRAAKTIDLQREELAKECFTDEERTIAADPKSEKSEELTAKIERFNTLFGELMGDETEVAVKTVSFESWHQFCAENELRFGLLDCELEGALFEGMEE